MSEGGLTDREVQDFAVTIAALLAGRCDGQQAVATTAAQVARIKADAYQQGRADLAAKVEAWMLARWTPDHIDFADLRAILATDATPTDAADEVMGR